jgi:hypothetical protein
MRKFLLAAALLAVAAFLAPPADAQPRGGKADTKGQGGAGKGKPKPGTGTTGQGEVQFVGKKKDGKFGSLSQDEARDFLLAKVPGRANQIRPKATSCVSDILGGQGKATGDFKYKGAPILHVSNGAGGTGCTVFYALRPSGKVQAVKVVAIGHHVGSTTYDMDWVLTGPASKGGKPGLPVLPRRINLANAK